MSNGSGAQKVDVPNVQSLALVEAETKLQQEGLSFKVTTASSNPQNLPPNTVVSQDPLAGTRVSKGTTVTLTIVAQPNTVAVPSVVGVSVGDASGLIGQQGLSVGTTSSACSNNYAKGIVTASSPAGGQQVNPGTSVNLTVSSGSCQVVVQSVVGMSQGSATSTLQGQGLSVTATTATTGCTITNVGVVVSQTPGGGSSVQAGASVTIAVCPAAPPTTSTTTTTAP